MSAKTFFVSAFFWIILGATLVALISYTTLKVAGFDGLDMFFKLFLPDKEGNSHAGMRGYLIGGLAGTTSVLLFWSSVMLQKQVKKC